MCLPRFDRTIHSAVYSPDGKMIATATDDHEAGGSCDTVTKHCNLSFHVPGDYLGCCNSSTGAWFCDMKCFLMHDARELIGSEDLQP